MNQRLFQDAGGTTPAIIAGQPVGLIKRLAGSVDAVQATALSKPTLARHPKSGVRNSVRGSEDYASTFLWRASGSTLGLTFEKVGVFSDPFVGNYVRYRMSGTVTGGGIAAILNRDKTRLAVGIGEYITASGYARIVQCTFPPSANVSFGRAIVDTAGTPLSYLSGGAVSATDWTHVKSTLASSVEGTAGVEINLGFSAGSASIGLTGEVIFDVAQVQMEYGSVATPYQFNYGLNDVTEPGVGDLWHLYNDGGDSLNVMLPAGTYGLASIDINRQITISTITSDGTTPINTLRHERQLDVILRAGAFSAGEETAIRDYWGRVFA